MSRPTALHPMEGRRPGLYRYALVDESGRDVGTFSSIRAGWRVGDWILTADRRRVVIVEILSASPQVTDAPDGIWRVEPA